MTTTTLLVVGIAGGTGSGKTTFARDVASALPDGHTLIIDHDAYYRDLADRPLDERRRFDFDHPDALETELLCAHLQTLRRGESIPKPVYDFGTHARRAEPVHERPKPVVIVEGILVLSDPVLRDEMDLKFFVDTPADIRLSRRIRRDVADRERTLESVLAQYESSVRPAHEEFVVPSMEHADLVVPGARRFARARSIAAAAIQHRLAEAMERRADGQ